MKVFYIILSLLFFLFAIAQVNDPDPWLWFTWYIFISILLAMAAFNRFWNMAIWIGIGVASVTLSLFIPSFIQWIKDGMPSIVTSMKAESPYIELVRETLGILLSLITLAGLLLHSRLFRRANAKVNA